MNTTNHNPIKLRWDKKADGRESAYIEYYSCGKRRKEFLKLYRNGNISTKESRTNEKLAEAILKKRIEEYTRGRLGIATTKEHILFHNYFLSLAEKRKPNTRVSWTATLKKVEQFDNRKDLTIADITYDWYERFADYLRNESMCSFSRMKPDSLPDKSYKHVEPRHMHENTIHLYLLKLRACITQAYKEGLISTNTLINASRPRKVETHKQYLDVEEVKLLMRTPYPSDVNCRAFLFSCFTGLRFSDVKKLTWGMISDFDGFARIDFAQTKTSGQEYLDIPPIAVEQMGPRKDAKEKVFDLTYVASANRFIKKWTQAAGINKHISFHCSRHTAAVTLLIAGTDIYTVSKILGHADVGTTQVYAKIVDSKRQSAMQNLNNLYGQNTDKIG